MRGGSRFGDPERSGGEARLEPWGEDGTARLVAIGDDPVGALLAALRGILALTLDGAPAAEGTAAVPVNGRGADLGAVAAALADDLLDQVQTFGAGFQAVRLDGMLETDDGGYSAWGYLTGDANGPSVPTVARRGPIVATQGEDGRVTLACTLERG